MNDFLPHVSRRRYVAGGCALAPLRRAAPALVALASVFTAQGAVAQPSPGYPVKPVRLVLPVPAGGPSDTMARTLGPLLARSFGQPLLVENRPGASGAIAAREVLRAAPDGHVLLWANASMASLPMVIKAAPFESLAEFAPVSGVGSLVFGLYVHPGVPAKTVAELIAHARANPDRLTYATATNGELMAAQQLLRSAGAAMLRVPYKGAPQIMPDLIGGRIDMNIGPVAGALSFVRSGQLRMLATLQPQRDPALPDVPTLAEAGFAGVSVPTWQALLAPPKTPREIAERLNRDVVVALQDAELRATYARLSIHIDPLSPANLAERIRADIRLWEQFVRDNGIVPE